ncbi:MAG: TonB-dependent receptor [Salinivirgaceae bacterium]|jgi:hypothetical protein|nr:TonB-dependent receptor [Salinivirgaceae bacterium]
MDRKITLLLIFIALQLVAYTQSGTISGTLTEKQGEKIISLPFANIFIEGTTIGTTSDFDGNFILKVQAGTYNLMCTFMGYETFKQAIIVVGGENILVNVDMKLDGIAIEGVEVVAKANRESESALILEQKNSAIAIEAIGAQQLSTQGVSNAAGAVAKVTGISKQEGTQSINVRGLGDRYNTTTLNGLPLPSNNAAVKNINLALFSTDIISHINIEKTFSSSLYGDFGGANIDIVSKRHDGDAYTKVHLKGGLNSGVFGLSEFYLQDGPGIAGFYSENEPNIDLLEDRSSYNFQNSWNPISKSIVPNIGIGFSGGTNFELAGAKKLNVFYTVSFDNEMTNTDITKRNINGSDYRLDDLSGTDYAYNTQTTGMLNLNYSSSNTELYYNSIVMNSSEQKYASLYGRMRDITDDRYDNGLRRQSHFERNFVVINQLLAETKLSNKNSVKWGLAYNYIENSMPDKRRTTFAAYDSASNIGWMDSEISGRNYRYFHNYNDNEVAANFSFDTKFGAAINDEDYRGKVTLGYSGRYKTRDFSTKQFNHNIYQREGFQLVQVDVDDVDSFIGNTNFTDSLFTIKTLGTSEGPGFRYNASLLDNAVFAALHYHLSAKLLVLIGLRFEYVFQEISYLSSQNISGREEQTQFKEFAFLPNLSIRYSLTDKSNLRFAASKTYTLPTFQEMPFLVFEGITERTYGNPWLYPSDVYNVDLKIESFPKSGEIYSATVFGKYIIDPINKLVVNGSIDEYTNANTGDWAYLYGIEIDAKRDLIKKTRESNTQKLFIAANVTLMATKQELNGKKIRKETNNNFNSNFNKDNEVLQGAAPMIANTTLGYNRKWNNNANSLTAALVYNYVSDRLYALGHSSLGNKIDKAVNTLDCVVKTDIKHIEFGVKAKNILNPTYERIQTNEDNDWLVSSYKKGFSLEASISYKF